MKAHGAVLLAALCFSTTGTATALAAVGASPLAVGAARILLGGAIFGVIAVPGFRRKAPDRSPRAWASAALGAAAVLAYQLTFFLGVQLNGVAVGTVVAIGAAPLATGVLRIVLRREAPEARWLVATGLAVVGVALVAGLASPAQLASVQPLGIAASLGAGVSYAVYTVAAKQLMDRRWAPSTAMGTVFGLASLLSVPVLAAEGWTWVATPRGALLVLWLGVVTTAVAYVSFGWGLARVTPSTVATLSLAEPLSATVWGVVVLREQLTAATLAGILVIAAGLALLSLPKGVARAATA